jgi:hypothetical protein
MPLTSFRLAECSLPHKSAAAGDVTGARHREV